ncbi:MAG: NADH-quinone oxidoreductase subunit N, partial [Dysgonamonadaceae bacterium]|nr:NADH-quinone oxidoreductase subunit N [Dysgonamonadaceae bacterium]
MNFSNFLLMGQEIGLVIVFLILFVYDIIGSNKSKNRWFHWIACIEFAVLTVWGFLPKPAGEAFGGIFVTSGLTVLTKNILNIATLIVFLQSYSWLNEENRLRRSEFFTITLVTLLGMYLMISAGNLMMLYVGMETASLPLACLAAFNKYREKSA